MNMGKALQNDVKPLGDPLVTNPFSKFVLFFGGGGKTRLIMILIYIYVVYSEILPKSVFPFRGCSVASLKMQDRNQQRLEAQDKLDPQWTSPCTNPGFCCLHETWDRSTPAIRNYTVPYLGG